MADDGTARAPREAAQGDGPASSPIPRISFDFVTGDVGAHLPDSSPDPPAAVDPKSGHGFDTDAFSPLQQACKPRFQVAVPGIPIDRRDEYVSVHSNIVELVTEAVHGRRGQFQYRVEFSDGRKELVSVARLRELENGKQALRIFANNMTGTRRKRKQAPDDEWGSDPGQDPMDIDRGDSSHPHTTRRAHVLRPRGTSTRHTSVMQSLPSDDDSDDDVVQTASRFPTRKLRKRQPLHPYFNTSMSGKSSLGDRDRDELANDHLPELRVPSDKEDGDFYPVISDIADQNTRRIGALQRARRLQAQRARSQRRFRGSDDSNIEFEQPRRSSRATRNMANMQDDILMDEDSFYVVDDKAPSGPKVVSVREIFQPLPFDSAFSTVHISTCHTCGGSKQRGQIVYCQGCSLSFHKQCLGPRSARDHLVTKIREDDFVLQCRFCVDIYRKRGKRDCEQSTPQHSMCQECRLQGQACVPFSDKKTARLQEKLREENGGTDPITSVSPTLVNNRDSVLFRCVACHRGWHLDHLPPAGIEPVGTAITAERIKDYMIDWKCNECSSTKYKIDRLVAWRPLEAPAPQQAASPSFGCVSEDNKEYLVKWDTLSYFHCTWMPGAWVFGTAPSISRTAFAKRAAQLDLLKPTEKEAIPNEYLMADIIFNVKMNSSTPKPKSKEAELAIISNVSRVLVKFQGLGYDDVVWDSPPSKDSDVYTAFQDAYREYVEGKYFRNETPGRIRDRIKSFKASEFGAVDFQPTGLKRGKLMGYQMEGLNWLLRNYHAGRSVVLADEMGLGKTIQVIGLFTSLIQDRPKCWPFLIVVPNATCPNWRREFKQWAPDLRVVMYHGGKESQDLSYKYELFPNGSSDMKAHVVIMSYDSAQDPKTRTLFKSVHWAGLVVDEGQRLKNDQSLLYLALRAMKIPFRLLLTGTPLQNNKRELFNLLQFIDESRNAAATDEEYQVLDKETLPRLHEMIRPYFLRRTKLGVLKFLPPMAQIILPVTMTVIQEKLSRSIMAKNPQLIKAIFANNKMSLKDRSSLNNILMQLRKCLCHPFMYSDAIEERHHDPLILHRNLVEASAKLLLLEVLLPKLKERGHRVLIFSQFLQQLDILEDFLAGMDYRYERLDGSISSLEKQRRIDAFNVSDSPLFAFLLSTRAGGVGINLATADTVIIMDPDFNPHQDIQALSRAHRIGQQKKVLCFQLMTKDTVEERIMQMGRKKMALDHALIESMDDDELAGDDLESILKHGAQALFSDNYQKAAIHYDDTAIDELLDRSQTEQTKADEEGSAETQFYYARVWANETSGFTEGLDTAEDQAPEPINSSVWDKILAQREDEARREAEANKEVLGRGGRRRVVMNYKTNATDGVPAAEGIEPMFSDSSDEFAGVDSADETEDQEVAAKDDDEGANIEASGPSNQVQAHPKVQIDPKTDTSQTRRGNPEAKQPSKEPQPPTWQAIHDANENFAKANPVKARYRNQAPTAQVVGRPSSERAAHSAQHPGYHHYDHNITGNFDTGVFSGFNTSVPATINAGVPGYHAHVVRGNQPQAYQAVNNLAGQPWSQPWSQPWNALPTPPPANLQTMASTHWPQFQTSGTEAQLRLAIDEVWHSPSNDSTKQWKISTLLHQLRALGMRNGTQQQHLWG